MFRQFCFLSYVTTGGKEGHGLKLEKVGQKKLWLERFQSATQPFLASSRNEERCVTTLKAAV